MTALHHAAAMGFVDSVKMLVQLGANLALQDKVRGWNVLHFAVPHPDVLKVLLPLADSATGENF